MIGRLTGKVTQEDDGNVVIDVAGVGYEVVVPLGTIGRAQTDAEGRSTLFVHTHVREDVFSLFGFATDGDRVAFRTLIGVSSVGPKTAIAVLSALPAQELGKAIARKELGKLTSISGIGKKTAERLLLELKGKFGPEVAGRDTAPVDDTAADVLRALLSLGYSEREVVAATRQLPAGTGVSDGIRQALKLLAKP